ncbi:hypothetical protein AtNW77_Chr1g0031591 [Arabidopsis thaliana]
MPLCNNFSGNLVVAVALFFAGALYIYIFFFFLKECKNIFTQKNDCYNECDMILKNLKELRTIRMISSYGFETKTAARLGVVYSQTL